MILVKHELRQGKLSLLIWTCSIGFLMAICIFLFPQMEKQMQEVSDVFASMGTFTAAFGMDQLNFGSFIGFYAVECGNILGLGGAFFAALCAAGMLSKEERHRTAEFLLTHPVSRIRVITEKWIAVVLQITILNVLLYLISIAAILATGETIPWKELSLLHLAFYLLQIEIAGICFGISAFLRKGSVAIGFGIAILSYFLNLISNITEEANWLRYVTPFAYCEAAEIVTEGALDAKLLLIGMSATLIGVVVAYIKYSKKEIHC